MNGVSRNLMAAFSVFWGVIFFSNIAFAQTVVQGFMVRDTKWNEESLIYLPGPSGRLIQFVFLDLSLVFESSDVRLTSSAVSNRNGLKKHG